MRLAIAAFALSVALPPRASAQENAPRPAGTYAFIVAVPVQECRFSGGISNSTELVAPQGAKFFYVQPSEDATRVVIQFLLWKNNDTLRARFNASSTDEVTATKTFCVARDVFDRLTVRVFGTGWSSFQVAAGALVLPVKMRSAPFDFSKDVTLGTTAGFRFRISDRREMFLSALAGIGLSSVTLGDVNTGNTVIEATDRAAVTWLGGLVLDIDKFQFGAFLGQDRISQPNQKDWVYQGKTWLALGLGYSLFGASSSKDSKENSK